MKKIKHDIIIIGSGLAALTTAARLYELGKRHIALYAKGSGSTPYIAAINFVIPGNLYGDTPEQYFEDMIHAGYGINNKKLVKGIAFNTLQGYNFLKRLGVEFAIEADGLIKLRHTAGHTYPRSLCSTTNLIGVEILKKMVTKLSGKVEFHMGHECVKVLVRNNKVIGITVKDNKDHLYNAYAPIVIAAWGGVGNLFGKSTYPQDIRGNTLAIAKEAGAKLVDLEFLEYEPMVLINPEGVVGEPCPTAMLSEGAHLLNSKGERFILKVRPQGEAGSSKTLLNKEIWKQINTGKGTPRGGVYADLRHVSTDILKTYPWFYNKLIKNDIYPNKELLEVSPMAHSFSGGIYVNEEYESTVKGFYAIGEACGGIHGACRCAGNAASQAVISGLLCAESIINENTDITDADIAGISVDYSEDKKVFDFYVPRVRKIVENVLGIYKNGSDLRKALELLQQLSKKDDVRKDTNTYQIIVSIMLIMQAALLREESRGSHVRLDYPDSRNLFLKQIIL